MIGRAPLSLSVRAISDIVCAARSISRSAVISYNRTADVLQARHLVMWLACRHTPKSMAEVGRILGRDPTTVLNAVRRVDARRAKDGAFAAELNALSDEVRAAAETFELTGRPVPSDICAETVARRIIETPRGAIRVAVIEIEAMAAAIVADLALRADVYRLLTAPSAEAGNAALDRLAGHFGAATTTTDTIQETAQP